MRPPRAIVVGCGVSGLSCAVRLIESDVPVELWTRDLPARTTSSVAGAIWYPFQAAPPEAVARWSEQSYVEFQRLAGVDGSGVTMRAGIELVAAGSQDRGAAHRRCARGLRELRRAELPQGFERGFEYQVPVIEMPIYLEHLLQRFRAGGGVLVERTIATLAEAVERCALVVNCTGLDARTLCDDREMVAIRGQVVRVERGGVERFVLDDYDPRGLTYVIPRSQDCVLGGTFEPGVENLIPDEASTRAILERCESLAPKLRGCRVLSVAVGLRPGRSSVRVEVEEPRPGRRIVHDYGHGGAGVTLSWGCANEVLALVTGARPVELRARS